MTTGAKVLGAVLVLATMAEAPARAEGWSDRLSISGSIQSDIRYVTDTFRGERPGQGHEFEMNRNDVNLRLRADPFDGVQAVIDTRMRYYGFNKAASLPELIGRSKIDPFDLMLNEAYLSVRGLPWSKIVLPAPAEAVQNVPPPLLQYKSSLTTEPRPGFKPDAKPDLGAFGFAQVVGSP